MDKTCKRTYPCVLCSWLPKDCKKIKINDDLIKDIQKELNKEMEGQG